MHIMRAHNDIRIAVSYGLLWSARRDLHVYRSFAL